MRLTLTISLMVLFAGCSAVPNAHPVALTSDEADRVNTALARWPVVAPDAPPLKRPFFATFRLGGKGGRRVTASGIIEYGSARDFRMTAVSEMGAVLFDGRFNWAGATVMRRMPELDGRLVEAILEDVSLALERPEGLNGLEAGDEKMILSRKPGDMHDYTWIFDGPSGRPESLEVERNGFDRLKVAYRSYTPAGWPAELQIDRGGRYEAIVTFTDNHVVQGNWRGNNGR